MQESCVVIVVLLNQALLMLSFDVFVSACGIDATNGGCFWFLFARNAGVQRDTVCRTRAKYSHFLGIISISSGKFIMNKMNWILRFYASRV